MKNNDMMVSVCCTAYNQEEYIRDALEGFVRQKTNFKYEIVIHDDASTDNTANIIREYESKYPDIIKPIYQKENQYQQGKDVFLNTIRMAKGKYVAVCEGDDYWIDENKLQIQVDYMENNPSCTMSFHNANVIDMETKEEKIFIPYNRKLKKYVKKDGNYNVGELELLEFIPTASFMFKQENVKKIPDWFEKCFVGDWPLKLIMTSFGYAHCINKVMCVYRKNAKGSVTVSNKTKEKQSDEGKKYILERKKEFINWIDEFTQGKYEDVFKLRRCEYEIEMLLMNGKKSEILEKKYLQAFNNKKKIKYLIKIYCPKIVELYKNIRNK